MTDLLPEGSRVAWTSRETGRHHTGEIVHVADYRDDGIDGLVYLVRPHGRALRWTDWVSHDEVTPIAHDEHDDFCWVACPHPTPPEEPHESP